MHDRDLMTLFLLFHESQKLRLPVSVEWVYCHVFPPFLQRETTFVTFRWILWTKKPRQMGYALKENKMLLWEDILSEFTVIEKWDNY